MGWIKAITPAVVKLHQNAPLSGKLAYNAIVTTAKASKVGGKVIKNAGKALPYVGAGLTAYGAASSYSNAVNSGEDPGRAAFRGIGQTLGGFGGGIGGGALGGPVGGIGGYIGGSFVGGKIANKAYDMITGDDNKPVNYSMTPDEQRALRQQIQQRRMTQGQVTNSSMATEPYYDLGGFRYSQGADPTLAALRLQQQAQNINAVQGYSTAKHLSNNQLRGQLGQQMTDRYGIGQMSQTERSRITQENLTARYGIGKEAEVENNRTRRDTTLGLGQQYTQRYSTGRMYDSQDRVTAANERVGLGQQYTQRYSTGRMYDSQDRVTAANERVGLGQQYTQRFLGSKELDNSRYDLETKRHLGGKQLDLQQYDLTQGYGLKERERQDKRFLQGRQLDNQYDVGVLNALSGFYR